MNNFIKISTKFKKKMKKRNTCMLFIKKSMQILYLKHMNIVFTRKITLSMPYGNLIFFSNWINFRKKWKKKHQQEQEKKAGHDGVFIYMYLLTSGFYQLLILKKMLTIF